MWQQMSGFAQRQRPMEMEALADRAAEAAQRAELLGPFDPLGDDGDVESSAEFDCRAHDRGAPAFVD